LNLAKVTIVKISVKISHKLFNGVAAYYVEVGKGNSLMMVIDRNM